MAPPRSRDNRGGSSPGQSSLADQPAQQDPWDFGSWWNQMSGRGWKNANGPGQPEALHADDPTNTPAGPDFDRIDDSITSVHDAGTAGVEAEHAAGQTNQETAVGASDDAIARYNAFQTQTDNQSTAIDQGLTDFQGDVQDQRDMISGIAQQFQDQMDKSSQFIQGLQASAMDGVKRGESGALQGAVQGVQGNVRNATAQIDNNINLTPAQKTQMKAQVRVQGGLGMAPITGKIKADFQAQANDINKTFGGMLAGLENTRGTGAAQIETAVAQMGTQLTNMLGNAQANRDQAVNSLLGVRGQAEVMMDEFTLGILPGMDEPYLDFTGVELTDYSLINDLVGDMSAEDLAQQGFDIQRLAASESANQFPINMILSMMQMFL